MVEPHIGNDNVCFEELIPEDHILLIDHRYRVLDIAQCGRTIQVVEAGLMKLESVVTNAEAGLCEVKPVAIWRVTHFAALRICQRELQ